MSGKFQRFSTPTATQRAVSKPLVHGIVEEGTTIRELPVDTLMPDPKNPRDLGLDWADIHAISDDDPRAERKRSAVEEIERLAVTIRHEGVLQPILAYRYGEGYRITMGEQRWAAARLAGLTTVPVILSDRPKTLRRQQLTENFARTHRDLWTALNTIRLAIEEHTERTGEQISTGEALSEFTPFKPRQARNYLALLNAPEPLYEAIQAGIVTKLRVAFALLNAPPTLRNRAIELLRQGRDWPTVRETLTLTEPIKQQPGPPVQTPQPPRGRPVETLKVKRINHLSVGRVIIDALLQHYRLAVDADSVAWDDLTSVQRLLNNVIAAADNEASRR